MRALAVPAAVVAVLSACFFTAILGNSTLATLLGLSVLLTAVEVAALRRRAKGFTPSIIPVVVINSLMTAGLLLWNHVSENAAVSAQLPAPDDVLRVSLETALLFTAAFTVGSLIVKPVPNGNAPSLGVRLPAGLLVAFGYVVLALALAGRGSALLSAPEYLMYNGPAWAAILAGALTPVAILALAFAAYQEGRHRMLAIVRSMVWALVLFAVATRQLALIPGMLLLGRMLAPSDEPRRTGPGRIIVAVTASLILAQLAIIMRSTSAGVGLFPSWSASARRRV